MKRFLSRLIPSAAASGPGYWPKRLFVLGMLVGAATFLAGCFTILPQWRPTREISRQDSGQVITDTTPIIVASGNERFVLFIGYTTAGDNELFLQRMNAAGQLVGSAVQLTNNSGQDDQPQMVEQGGWLYVVWRYRLGSNSYQTWWARVDTATLAYAAGPAHVSSPLAGDSNTPQLAVRADGTSVVVWAQENPTSTIYYRQVVSNATFAGAPVIVSQGTGCASGQFSQYLPRVTRSFFSGAFSQIAWIGQSGGGDSVFWREFDNTTNSPSSNCLILSDAMTYSGQEIDLDLAINPYTNRSFVAWTHLNDVSLDGDIYVRGVEFSNLERCDVLNVSNAVTTTHEGGVRIAAGHGISNWVHLVWERFDQTAAQGAIRYALVQDGLDCTTSLTPTKITPAGNISLTIAPVPGNADVDSPRIAVATNAVIARVQGSGGTLLALAGAPAAPGDAGVSVEGVEVEREERHAGDEDVKPALPELSLPGAGEPQNTGAPPALPDCQAEPAHPRCQELAALQPRLAPMSAQAASAASSFQCGSNAADAVLVSFFDDQNNRMYAALFQAGEVLYNGICYRGVSAQYPNDGGLKVQALTRTDYVFDHDDHYPFMSTRGLPTVAWSGREPETFLLSQANDEIYVAEAMFTAYTPIVRKP